MSETEPSLRSQIDAGLSKRFRRSLLTPFCRALTDYDLLSPGDKVAVCISGGKDSMLMAALFREVKRHNRIPFELEYLAMDPGYSPANRAAIERNAELLELPLHIFETHIFEHADAAERSPCYLCARMRRGHLYAHAKELGCNKIALGHHYDDVIETTLMGLLWGGQFQTMMPKLHSSHYEGMDLIRPMYLIREADILRWRDAYGLEFLRCACHFTENCSTVREDGTAVSKRLETKRLIAELKKTNPQVEENLFHSTEGVNLHTILSYKKDGVLHRFTDNF